MNVIRISRHSTIAAIAGAMILLCACAPSATYPPVETTAKLAKPTFEPIPTVMATAIKYVRDYCTPGQDLAINLPAGMSSEVYDMIFEKLGSGRPMTMPDEKAIHIQEVRTRNFNAQVDVIYPRADGFNQLMTITMKRSLLENYRVERVRPWQLTDVMAMAPNYVAPPPPEVEAVPVEESNEAMAESTPTSAEEDPTSTFVASPSDHLQPQK
jgi:hypothetical protein